MTDSKSDRWQLWWSLTFILISVSLFTLMYLPYTVANYILVIVILSAVLFLFKQVNDLYKHIAAILLISIYLKIIVIDPAEIGIFGRDSYDYFWRYLTLSDVEIIKFISNQGWPQLFVLTKIIESVTSAESEIIAKFIPMISVLCPIFVYITSRRLISSKIAPFYISVSLSVSGAFTILQSKFVPEMVGICIFFLLLFVVYTKFEENIKTAAISVILISSLVLSHPIVALIGLSTLILSYTYKWSIKIGYILNIKNRLFPEPDSKPDLSSFNLIAVYLSFYITIYAYLIPELTFGTVLLNPYSSGGYNIAVEQSQLLPNATSVALSNYLLAGVLGILAISLAIAGVSKYKLSIWEITLSTMCAGMLTYYAVDVIIGVPFPLSGSRLLIYIIPFLFLAAGSVYVKVIEAGDTVIIFLCLLLLISQILTIPIHVLSSDPNYTIPEVSGHPTLSDRHFSEWGLDHGYFPISQLQSQNSMIKKEGATNVKCRDSENAIYKNNIPNSLKNNRLSDKGIIYDSHYISAKRC